MVDRRRDADQEPEQRGQQRPTQGDPKGVGKPLDNLLRYRPARANRLAQVPLHRTTQETPELLVERQVEPQLRPDPLNDLRTRLETRRDDGRIAGNEVDDEEDEQRDAEQDGHDLHERTRDVTAERGEGGGHSLKAARSKVTTPSGDSVMSTTPLRAPRMK